jgi:hypothetical protein
MPERRGLTLIAQRPVGLSNITQISSRMAARLANTIYWSACIAAVLWALFVFAIGAVQTHPDWTISTPIAIAGAVVIWITGRAIRYVLSGQ